MYTQGTCMYTQGTYRQRVPDVDTVYTNVYVTSGQMFDRYGVAPVVRLHSVAVVRLGHYGDQRGSGREELSRSVVAVVVVAASFYRVVHLVDGVRGTGRGQ